MCTAADPGIIESRAHPDAARDAPDHLGAHRRSVRGARGQLRNDQQGE